MAGHTQRRDGTTPARWSGCTAAAQPDTGLQTLRDEPVTRSCPAVPIGRLLASHDHATPTERIRSSYARCRLIPVLEVGVGEVILEAGVAELVDTAGLA